ncbi:hypothetical protein HanRHA438_Chr10g0433801 [Helianthus annuus]|nr:hypothetical protein HanRHA438_Chr10g0433801 [Helianthus annuus]
MYFSWDSVTEPSFLLLVILIPSICLAGPKSFISNSLDICFFNLLISFISEPAINISST